MLKKLTKTDILFIISLTIGVLALSIYLFTHPYYYDETYYPIVPFRLIQGDSLIQHEWHLTQFSSLFIYLPVKIWLAMKGSTEGIIVFLRCVYFLIHTATAAVIYNFFRKHGNWAIAAAMIFFTQVSYRIFAISYNSMFVLFSLFCTLCLLSIYKSKSNLLYILAGFCYACACVCNPVYCFAFVLYIIACALWKTRHGVKKLVIKIKKNIVKKDNPDEIDAFPNMESYTRFFCKEAILFSFIGISIAAVISIAFFLLTGGDLSSVLENIPHLLNNSEYTITSLSFLRKLESTMHYFNRISFDIPYILPVFLLILFLDKGKKNIIRRWLYLSASFILSVFYMFGIFNIYSFYSNFYSLPLLIFSITCYALTENKNKTLFWCMWMPSLIAAVFQYISSNTFLTPLGLVLAINNIAGVIFVKDLFSEIKVEQKPKSKAKTQRHKSNHKAFVPIIKAILCTGLCAQILFHGFVLQYEQIPLEKTTKATEGPLSGIIMTQQQKQIYTNTLADFDLLNSLNKEKSPVLAISSKNWVYFYNNSPMATHTAWTGDYVYEDTLIAYYEINPDKIPKYIYVDMYDSDSEYSSKMLQRNLENLSKMFEFTQEELSNSFLLTVEKCKF